MTTTCRCGSILLSLETKGPGVNRGRWYLKCPTGTCSFFKWDDSPHPFIRHPVEAYAAAQPLNGTRLRPIFNIRSNSKDNETTLTKNTVHVSFSLLSSTLIGLKTEANLTLDPVIEKIKDIQWSDHYDQWTIPATVTSYNIAISSLPREVPNLQIEVDPIPPSVLDSIIEATLLKAHTDSVVRAGKITEVEMKWTEFVESATHRILRYPLLQKAVCTGIERGGRILIGNENGIGSIESALALTKVYKEEWPILIMCPSITCQSWKHQVKSFLGLTDDQISMVDPKTPKNETFNQSYIDRKRKATTTTTTNKPRRFYKQKMRERANNDNYESSSSEEEEEAEDHGTRIKPVLCYIIDYELAAKRRKDITAKEFKIMLCGDSHYIRSWTKGESKFICNLLQKTKRCILTSPSVKYLLPVNLFTQVRSISPSTFQDFDTYSKRYCDCKSTVFGLNMTGRSNKHEFNHILDSTIWYAPSLEELKEEMPDFIRQVFPVKVKKSTELKRQVDKLIEDSKAEDVDLDAQDTLVRDLHKKTGELKKELIPDFLVYTLETYKRPKIAIMYYNTCVFQGIKQYFDKKHIKFNTLIEGDHHTEVCEKYNKSKAVQFMLLDMKMEDLSISLDSVDLAIFVELPFDMAKLNKFESFFKSSVRKGPLCVKYLAAEDTIDDYLWPIVQTF